MRNGKFFDELMDARRLTEEICRPLQIEDYVVQPEECVSPPKWHLAHTTWFLEVFLLQGFQPDYKPYNPHFNFLFNSYYETLGPRSPRAPRSEKGRRGSYSRPTVEEVYRYRHLVETSLGGLCASPHGAGDGVRDMLELGRHHEEQHQELLLTDIKRILHGNPSRPAYIPNPERNTQVTVSPRRWIEVQGGLHDIGWAGGGFAFDNEKPRHPIFLRDFRIEDRLVTNSRYLEFIRDGGYERPELWLSDGWQRVSREGWRAPLYWTGAGAGAGGEGKLGTVPGGDWSEFTLHGQVPLDPEAPVCHVSYFEADAFARWGGARLPTEGEWETAVAGPAPQTEARLPETGHLHPVAQVGEAGSVRRTVGELWEWTSSAYLPYPGFTPLPGSVGEYNGKFMIDQMVLRGGSCVTPRGHMRPTYRNYFPAATRWQFSGIRLAEDI